MTDLFEEDVDLDDEAFFAAPDEEISVEKNESATIDARRRLEKMLEDKRLKDELEDFGDY